MKVALDRPGKFARSEQSRSNVPPKYASAHRQAQGGEEDRTTRRFLARLAPGTFLTGLTTELFNTVTNRYSLFEYRSTSSCRLIDIFVRRIVHSTGNE